MPLDSIVVAAIDCPPVAEVYHWIAVPVAERSETIAPEHSICIAAPVGAGVVIVVSTVEPDIEQPSGVLAVAEYVVVVAEVIIA
jgi:hypothetical protein